MRVAIVALGSAGDVHPFVAVGRELRERGHEVAIYASAWYEEAVGRAGLRFEALGSREQYLEMTTREELWDPRRAFPFLMQEFVLPLVKPLYAALAAEARAGAVLVGSSLDLAGRLVQEKHGAPFVTVHVAPAILRTIHRMPVFQGTAFVGRMPRWFRRGFWWLSDKLFDPTWVPQLNGIRKEIGLPPVRRPFEGWWNSPTRVLGLWPEWFGPAQPDWPHVLRLTGFPFFDRAAAHPMSEGLAGWLDEGTAPVVFTHGSANVQGARFFAESLSVCARLGVRGLLVTSHPGDVPPGLPPSVRHEPYVPFSLVLPRARGLVSHGGIGTVAQGLRAGIPQLVVAMAHDQHDNGSRLEDLGAGRCIDAQRYDAARGASLLAEVLQGARPPRDCAERIRRENGSAAAADAILTVASAT